MLRRTKAEWCLIMPDFPRWQRRLLLLAPPAVTLLFAAVLFASIQGRRRSTERVQRTYAVIGQLRQVRTRLVEAETGQRGYIITGDTAYLGSQRNAARDVPALLDSLRVALGGYPEQAAGLARLQARVTGRLGILEVPVRRRAESFEAARDELIAGRGTATMEVVRADLRRLESVERQRLAAEIAVQKRADWQVLGVLFAGTLVVLVVAGFTRKRFAHFERELERGNTALADLNARLQEQALELELQTQELQLQTAHLEEASAELMASNEELQRQHQQLQDMAAELETANDDLQMANTLAEQRRAEAEAANQVKTQFLTSMSHELRTPLNAIAGYVDLLDFNVHGPLTEAQRHSLQRIRLNGRHLLVLINDILDYAKIQAGRVELRNRDVALSGLIAETAELVVPLFQARSIAFRVEPGSEVQVLGDPDRIRQILLNLFTNAAKYSESGGVVLVSTDADNERVRLSVHDQGIGIPPEMHAAIFDPFVRLNRDAGGSLGDGVGLGLSISRELAVAMHGDLSVASTPGEGSTFTLTLCRVHEAALDPLSPA